MGQEAYDVVIPRDLTARHLWGELWGPLIPS